MLYSKNTSVSECGSPLCCSDDEAKAAVGDVSFPFCLQERTVF